MLAEEYPPNRRSSSAKGNVGGIGFSFDQDGLFLGSLSFSTNDVARLEESAASRPFGDVIRHYEPDRG